MSTWTSERARIAAITRGIRAGERRPDDPELINARRNLAALRLEDYIERKLAAAPPLSDEQLTRLAELLRPARQAAVQARPGELDTAVGT